MTTFRVHFAVCGSADIEAPDPNAARKIAADRGRGLIRKVKEVRGEATAQASRFGKGHRMPVDVDPSLAEDAR